MNIIRLTKEFRFEGAHALMGYDGNCCHIHGHSYLLGVTVSGAPNNCATDPKNGMIIDFTSLKELINKLIIDPFDHALLLRKDAPLAKEILEQYKKVLIFSFQPTCEQLCIYFASLLAPIIPTPVKLFSIRLSETTSSFAEWFASDNI
jgi:6-pyruvoyltetrahydropterin/6-carboxytetrahydropterin synthase